MGWARDFIDFRAAIEGGSGLVSSATRVALVARVAVATAPVFIPDFKKSLLDVIHAPVSE
jgi:hypothetical protein